MLKERRETWGRTGAYTDALGAIIRLFLDLFVFVCKTTKCRNRLEQESRGGRLPLGEGFMRLGHG